jgi:nucleotidyltransferase-like protein
MNDRMFAELFGGGGRYRALRYLFEHAGEEFSSRELAAAAHTDRGNTHRWLKRWEEAGLVVKGAVSATNFVAAGDPALAPLVALFRQSSDLVAELHDTLAAIEGVTTAVIFGSFARNEEKADSDIDVLILGDVSELKANALLRPLSRKYGRAFNASVFQVEQFRHLIEQGDSFASEVMAQPRLTLLGDLDAEIAR